MAKQSQGKRAKAGGDDTTSRQPAWREQAPAHPRKRIRRKPMSAPASGLPVGSGRPGNRAEPDRFSALTTRETWLSILRIAVLLLAAAAATTGLIYLLRWPELAVAPASTQIGGNVRITKEEVYAGSGIDGRNILLLRPADIAAQVQKIPGVAKASAHVRLPNQVIIDIREHAPLVAWQGVTETVWLAEDGAAVPQAGAKPPLSFTDRANGRVSGDPALRKLVLDNLKAIYAVRPEISEFSYADEPGLYYRAPEGWDVWLGDSGAMNEKLALADSAAKEIAAEGGRPKVIDVRQSERKALWK